MQFERIADKKRVDFIVGEICRTLPEGSLILDIGCGNGIISKAVAQAGYRVVATDISAKTIEAAIAVNNHPLIEYKVIPAGQLRPEPSVYSAVICSEVLEHLEYPQTLLNTVHTSLKNDGILIVTVPNGYGPRELLVTKPVQYIQKNNNLLSKGMLRVKKLLGYTGTTIQSSADDLTHVQFFTFRSLQRLAKNTGFRIVTTKKINFIEQVFPFSILTRRSILLQRIDCLVADVLPMPLTSGFMCVWKKRGV